MKLSPENAKSMKVLLSAGLFQTEEDFINYTTNYAFNADSHEEETLEIDVEIFSYVKNLSEKSSVSISFLMNRILQRYFENNK